MIEEGEELIDVFLELIHGSKLRVEKKAGVFVPSAVLVLII